jgi:haloalkane dehalogenase
MTGAAGYAKKHQAIDGLNMAYVEAGSGAPIVFLHGNPTSSYLWRNVMPHVEGLGRCIAPDLIGMGDSDKLPDSGPGKYRLAEHAGYLEKLLDALGVNSAVTLVAHDWGGPLAFDWARRHAGAVKGIAYMETIVAPLSWEAWPNSVRPVFQGFRSEKGEKMVLEDNFFVEKVLPSSIMRKLSDEEMNVYRKPFLEAGESRRPTLTWPREIPLDGEPADVTALVEANAAFMAASPMPKLFINADPGAILRGDVREACRAWPNQTEVTVPGVHFIQEDSADQIGAAIAAWLGSM